MPNVKVLHLRSAPLVGDNLEWKFSKRYLVFEDLFIDKCELCHDEVLLSFIDIGRAITIFTDASKSQIFAVFCSFQRHLC